MKKTLKILLLSLLFISSKNVSADINLLNDEAGILNENEINEIENFLISASNATNSDVVVTIVDGLDGKEIGKYADDYYDTHGYRENGIIFVIDMDSRSWYVSTCGDCIDYISDYEIDDIMDYSLGYIADGDFVEGINQFASKFTYYYNYDDSGDIDDYSDDIDPQYTRKGFGLENVGLSAIIGAIASLVTNLTLKGQLKNVSKKYNASSYVDDKSFVLTGYSNFLINTHVSKSPIPKNNNHSSGGNYGSGHSSHISSSGVSHGGHGGHF